MSTESKTTESLDSQTYDLDKTDAERCDVAQASNAGQQQRDSRRDGTLTTIHCFRCDARYSPGVVVTWGFANKNDTSGIVSGPYTKNKSGDCPMCYAPPLLEEPDRRMICM